MAGSQSDIETQRVLVAGQESLEIPTILPVLPVRDVVVFPGVTVPLAIGRQKSLAALDAAGPGGFMVVATQRDPGTEDPRRDDLYGVGCVVRVIRVIDARRDGRQAVVVGVLRTKLGELLSVEPALSTRLDALEDIDSDPERRDGLWRRAVALATQVIDLHDDYPDEWKEFVSGIPTAGLMADIIGSTLPMPPEDKVALLGQPDAAQRLERIVVHLEREVTIAQTQRELSSEAVGDELEPERRARLLRRRMREIEEEIGEGDPGIREAEELREKLEAARLPEAARTQAERELQRLAALPQHAPDRHLIRTYVEWMIDLPWSVETDDKLELPAAREILDADHHDLQKVKDRILEFLAVRKLAHEAKSPILCFVGPPGVGKTSLGRSVARAMGRKFARASLGGVRDEAEIRGHRRTYVGAMPGRILQSLKRAGSRNPVFLLDEIDKLGADFRGDPSSALLEVLDPEQNHAFSDHYIEVPFDLSHVLFIATANTLATVPPALLDRMEVIELPGYTENDKHVIARRHLVPKQLEAHGLTEDLISVTDAAIDRVVQEYTREAGVRNLDRQIATLMRKCAHKLAPQLAALAASEAAAPTTAKSPAPDESLSLPAGPVVANAIEPIEIDADFVVNALGAPPHLPETAERTVLPGVAVGLATTRHGGDILFIEATIITGGEGVRLRLTGQLGDVMRESAEAALSWVRSNAESLGLDSEALSASEIHLHVPSGAVPKDGPSAGIALATALVSALSGRRARGHVAMTGEISLRGKVLPVGGIKAKVLAASRAGIEVVILPRRNQKDLVELPEEVLEKIRIETVDGIEEALALALEESPAASD